MKSMVALISLILCLNCFFDFNDDEFTKILELAINKEPLDTIQFKANLYDDSSVFVLVNDIVRKNLDIESYEGIKLGKKVLYCFPEEHLFTFEITKYIQIKSLELHEYEAILVMTIVEEKVWTKKEEKFGVSIDFKKVDGNWKIVRVY